MRRLLWIVAAFASLTLAAHAQHTNQPPTARSRVVLVRDADSVNGLTADAARARQMLATGIKSLTEQRDEADAWRTFASSNDVVGIKINTLGAPLHATQHAVVDAIVDGLLAAGVRADNIIVWDRDPNKMRPAGYAVVGSHPRVKEAAVIADTGWDADAVYEEKLVGKLIWGDLLFGTEEELSTRSHLPKLLTRTITKLINVPVLQDHEVCGIAGCLYNVSLGMVDNTRRFEGYSQRGVPAIPEICAMPAVRSKLVLNVMDAFVGGFAGGPGFKPQYSWPFGGVLLSRDPVAVDAIGLELLESKRAEAKVTAIDGRASHIAGAERLGLGRADRANIDLVELGPAKPPKN